MGNLRNILVVIEIKQLRQPALERGIALYNYAMAHNKIGRASCRERV